MDYQKEDVLPKAEGMWVDILIALTDVDPSIFNSKKEHPCPLCGGKTRFRYRNPNGKKLDRPFFCNVCGSKNGVEMLVALTGMNFREAINAVGNYLNLIPAEKINVIHKQHTNKMNFPDWYLFDQDKYDEFKKSVTKAKSSWQLANGIQCLNGLYDYKNRCAVPLYNESGDVCDAVLVNLDNEWATTCGSISVPPGFYSKFGKQEGNYTFLAQDPLVAAKAASYMRKLVLCTWSGPNLAYVAFHFERPVVIVSNLEECREADACFFDQMKIDMDKGIVSRKFYKPDEITSRGQF